ncbi:probable transcriptional regulator SLK2 [Camellia sinensis]|nr:probable transcriptional regulator SLK2 [Camellia sinensis]
MRTIANQQPISSYLVVTIHHWGTSQGSSVMDGSSVVQQSSNQDPSFQRVPQSQQQQRASNATSLPTSRMGQVSLPPGPHVPGSFIQDPNNIAQLQKKPRLDIKQEDIMQQ